MHPPSKPLVVSPALSGPPQPERGCVLSGRRSRSTRPRRLTTLWASTGGSGKVGAGIPHFCRSCHGCRYLKMSLFMELTLFFARFHLCPFGFSCLLWLRTALGELRHGRMCYLDFDLNCLSPLVKYSGLLLLSCGFKMHSLTFALIKDYLLHGQLNLASLLS